MIDWINVASNAVWILGCAIALAALSYASWEASLYHEKLATRLKRPSILAALYLGGLLVSLGMAATAGSLLEIILWLLLALLFGAQLVRLRRSQ
jgi:hypothetical protein